MIFNTEAWLDRKINIPCLDRQREIAAGVASVDRKIALLTEEREAAERFKTGTMDRIFRCELRFRRDDGAAFPEWREGKIGDVFKKVRSAGSQNLPLFAVSQKHGLISRDEIERDHGADADASLNLRVAPGDLVYNTMRMWQGAVALAQVHCAVSPAYVVVRPKGCDLSLFFLYWLKWERARHLLWSYSHGLTDDRLRLYFDDFAQVPVAIPHPDEQAKIAATLSILDAKVAAINAQIAAMKSFRHGLLQKLFP